MATSSEPVCGICKFLQKTNTATVWCPECEDTLCLKCQEHHSISKASRDHTTIPIKDYQKLPSFILGIKLFCEEHNAKYQNYCLNHEQPLCKKCVSDTHTDCKNIKTLDDVTRNAKSSVAMEVIQRNTSEILSKIKLVIQDREENLAKINQQRNNILQEISRARDQVNQQLDKTEKDILTDLSSVVKTNEKRLNDLVNSIKSKENEMKNIRDSIVEIQRYASDFQTFLGMKEMEKSIYQEEKYIQSIYDDSSLNEIDIICNLENKITNLTTELTKFGKISTQTCPPTIILSRESDNQAQIPKPGQLFVYKSRLKLKRQFEVGNRQNLIVTGCCIMNNGDLVFACYDIDNLLAIHESSGSFKHDITLDSKAYDVTAIDDRTVAVTSGLSYKINIVDVVQKKIVKSVNTKGACHGISYTETGH